MLEFLAFRLYGPLASWGDVAVGEFRPSFPGPTKSAVLGLVAAALGVKREDDAGQRALRDGYGVAMRVDDPGTLVSDYHTVETPHAGVVDRRAKSGVVPATRRDELRAGAADEAAKTNLSRREYRMDSLAAAALWRIDADSAPWSLQSIAEALHQPHFLPYLGRKSCSVALPFSPMIVVATHPVAALRTAVFPVDEMLGGRSHGSASVQFRWEEVGLPSAADSPTPDRIERRRDEPGSRTAWLFGERRESVLTENTPRTAKEGLDVSEQS